MIAVRVRRNSRKNLQVVLVVQPHIGKKAGRGAYVCPDKECITKAYKGHRLEKALEKQVNDDVYKKLLEELKHE